LKQFVKSISALAVVLLSVISLTLAQNPTASSNAQTLSGTVTNGTTNKPAVGDEVILINLTSGMEIAANTKADAEGKFSFKLTGGAGPHLIRAVHQGVTYHQIAPPGVSAVDVKVYDVTNKVNEITLTADVIRFQADSGTMQGVRLFVVNNASSPAKTQMNDHNFEFYLPAGAKVEQVQARAPKGQPIATQAVPLSEKNRYAIAFPLRPGETQFQLEFTFPYTGEIKIDPKLLYPAEHFVVVVPKTMQFKAATAESFEAVKDPSQGDNTMEVAQQTKIGQPLGFTLKGNGMIVEPATDAGSGPPEPQGQTQSGPMQEQNQGPEAAAPGQPTRDNRPGGGLGIPIDAPDALQRYKWPIIGVFCLLLIIGGWIVTKRPPGPTGANSTITASAAAPPITTTPTYGSALRPAPAVSPTVTPPTRSAMLLEALKEELFQLEVEKNQGKITPEEYAKAKAALDQTLDRALKRQG
jgi:hypothetical protein